MTSLRIRSTKITFIFTIISLIYGILNAAKSQDAPLVADLSDHLVAITTGFRGADVLLFGSTNGPGDIIVVVRGPPQNIKIRQKERFGPIWVNKEEVKIVGAPSFYWIASNKEPSALTKENILARYQIGLENLRFKFENQTTESKQLIKYTDAFIRLKKEKSHYDANFFSLSLLGNRLFRTEISFPANVPTGTYLIEVYLLRKGEVVSAEIIPLSISKIGVGAEIYEFAQNFSAAYGLIAIVLAVIAGLAAEAIFRN